MATIPGVTAAELAQLTQALSGFKAPTFTGDVGTNFLVGVPPITYPNFTPDMFPQIKETVSTDEMSRARRALEAQGILYDPNKSLFTDKSGLVLPRSEIMRVTNLSAGQLQDAVSKTNELYESSGKPAYSDSYLGLLPANPQPINIGGNGMFGSFFSFISDVGGGLVDLGKDFLGAVSDVVDTVVDPIADTLGVHPDVVKVAAAALGMYYAPGVGFTDAAGATVSEAAAAEAIASSGAQALAASGNLEAAAALAAGAESLAVPSMLPGATAFPVATAPLATMGGPNILMDFPANMIDASLGQSYNALGVGAGVPAAAVGANALTPAFDAASALETQLAADAGSNALATGAGVFDAASALETQLNTIAPGASAADLAWMDTVSPSQLEAISTGALPGAATLPFSISDLAKFAKDYGVPLSALTSAVMGSRAATDAANIQAQSAREARQLARDIFNEQKALQEPYRAAGITAQNQLLNLLGRSGNTAAAEYGKYARPFGMADFQADPGYAFRLSEGMKALEASRAARGGLLSGATGKALTRYGQDVASQEYGNAFNRYQTERANRLNPLAGLTASGQAAAAGQAANAGNYATTAGNLITDIGAAQAAGGIGSANAITNALNQFARYSAGQNIANQIRSSVYAPALDY